MLLPTALLAGGASAAVARRIQRALAYVDDRDETLEAPILLTTPVFGFWSGVAMGFIGGVWVGLRLSGPITRIGSYFRWLKLTTAVIPRPVEIQQPEPEPDPQPVRRVSPPKPVPQRKYVPVAHPVPDSTPVRRHSPEHTPQTENKDLQSFPLQYPSYLTPYLPNTYFDPRNPYTLQPPPLPYYGPL